jgi:hypothetical protein
MEAGVKRVILAVTAFALLGGVTARVPNKPREPAAEPPSPSGIRTSSGLRPSPAARPGACRQTRSHAEADAATPAGDEAAGGQLGRDLWGNRWPAGHDRWAAAAYGFQNPSLTSAEWESSHAYG